MLSECGASNKSPRVLTPGNSQCYTESMPGFPSSLSRTMALLFLASASACGLRSDPFAPDYVLEDETDSNDDNNDPGDPNRPGTCNDPLSLPFSPMTLRGELSGPSFSEGWCGSDGGAEDIYTLIPEYDVDVIITLDTAETDFVPTLRVVEDGCAVGTGTTKICTNELATTPFHFLAQQGHVYSVIIDSPEDTDGRYAFGVDFGWPPINLCPVHPESIRQLSGSAFLWNNDLAKGQGQVDGYCGGVGRENMFAVEATYAGNMYVQVESSGVFSPSLSFRTDCAALSELACTPSVDPNFAELAYFIAEPGIYYLVVDQTEIGDGGYSLRVDFD